MRAFGYWYGTLGGAVINNVRWGEVESFYYCFDGIPKNSIVSIGTVASELHKRENRKLFETGFAKLLEVLEPHTIIIYGSDKYLCFDSIRQKVNVVNFKSERTLVFEEANS